MSNAAPLSIALAPIDDCWNRIGVRGDRSCGELSSHVHCRNCPVYSTAAAVLRDRESDDDYVARATIHLARPSAPRPTTSQQSVVIFRIADEWLALPTATVVEVAPVGPVHSLPRRQRPALLGIASVRAELLVCMSLARMLGVSGAAAAPADRRAAGHRRMLVLQHGDLRLACPVDEVDGVHRVESAAIGAVPATVGGTASYSTGLLTWRDRAVGVLDAAVLFEALERGMA